MMSIAPPWCRHIAAIAGLLVLVATSGVALSQDARSEREDRELALVDALARAEEEFGPLSGQLIAPLTELGLFYEESGNLRLSESTISQLRAVIRANYGLYSLEQADTVRILMAHELERGNAAAAWDLEQELIELGLRNPDDARTARIFHDVGDRRLDILRRYDAGELPPEIELGCYYNDPNEFLRVNRRGSRPLATAPGRQMGNGCSAGSRGDAKRALAGQAHTFYLTAIDILQRNDLEGGAEIGDIFATLVRSSYENGAPNLGRRILRHLMSTQPENSLARIEALVQLADWDLMHSQQTGTKARDSALEAYEAAYRMLAENGFEQATIDTLFSPDVPIMLPAFLPDTLVSPETPTSSGHLDIQFVVTFEGKGDDIEILETSTADVSRIDRKAVVDQIKRGRFRPVVADGEVAESSLYVIRYYLN